jgi:DNA-binding LacI/PurR family transcriptional regulator
MEDVAAAAGVSRALVSLVMRNRPNVSQERRARVLDAASRLGYRANAVARILASRRSHTIGVLLNDLHNPFFGEIADGIDGVASSHGYRVLINTGYRRPKSELEALDAWLELRTGGVILVSTVLEASHIVAASQAVPLVVLSRHLDEPAVDTIVTDDRRGAAVAVEHLFQLGHQRIVHVDGGRAAGAAMRRAGYRRAMRRLGLREHARVIRGEFTDLSGVRAAELLMREGELPTAIFAGNDFMAAGIVDQLEKSGVRVPEDISVMGYDNTSLAALHHLSLTTIDQPRVDMGRLAMQTLIARIEDPGRRPMRQVLSPSLVVRRTTAPPRGGSIPERPTPRVIEGDFERGGARWP